MMNFALGEWVVFGAVLAGTGLHFLHLGTVGALLFAAIGMIALAAGFYHLVVRRLVARPALSAIMATLGLGMVMRGSGLLMFSGAPGLFPTFPLGVGREHRDRRVRRQFGRTNRLPWPDPTRFITAMISFIANCEGLPSWLS
jgi:branched-subunit amino acid ABC-type transport system permease component